ncbi:hypothetical protein [Paludisphaera soli]|uniref:hypothetical protein n=1 Tax=Paludisphaera soli TaxID=2712865 RepID=UPI0013ECB738|nr:hypothetical protein [Paludisphaera soli]
MIRLVARWSSSIALGLLVVGPPAAIAACALVDLGPDGELRATLFPVAIAALDPFVWTCLRQSATTAGLASLTAVVVGVVVGRLIGDRAFRLRPAALALLTAIASMPPVALAIGAATFLAGDAAGAWSGLVGRSGPLARFCPADPNWLVWFGAATLPGAAAGVLAYAAALDRLDPSWRDAARMAGGGGTRVWRRLAWPLIRPAMARVAGLVFAITLADPGPPLILGLRRTLGFQVVSVGLGPSPFPRVAVLGLLALLVCAAVRGGLRLWAGPTRLDDAPRRGRDEASARVPASWPRLFALATILGLASGLAVAPLAGLVGMLGDAGGEATGPGTLTARLVDPTTTRMLGRSLVLGLGVAALVGISARAIGRLEAGAGAAAAGRFRRLARLAAPPPLVAGVAILAFGLLIRHGAGQVDARTSLAATSLLELPGGDCGMLFAPILGVWLATIWARLDGRRPPRGGGSASARDAALLAGAGRNKARRLARDANAGRRWRAAAAVAAAAAVNVAPAVLLASSPQVATVGAGLLLSHERPDGGAAVAAALALLATAACAASAFLDPRESPSQPG